MNTQMDQPLGKLKIIKIETISVYDKKTGECLAKYIPYEDDFALSYEDFAVSVIVINK